MSKRIALAVLLLLLLVVGLGIFLVVTKVDHRELGYKFWRGGNTRQALAEFTLEINDNPGKTHGYVDRAGVFSELGMYDEAISDLTSAIALDPAYGFSYGERGTIYSKNKQWDLAWKDFDSQVRLDPSTCFGWAGRGYASWNLGNLKEALSDFETYVSRRGNCQDGYSLDKIKLAIRDIKSQLGIAN